MKVFQAANVQSLTNFPNRQDQLAIVKRTQPDAAHAFFQKLIEAPFKRVIGRVCKDSSMQDIQDILAEDIPATLQKDPFYALWISDMADICSVFCDTLESQSIGFCLGTERGCRRYHIDNVPMRLLVTYAGQGTEWLPDEAANRRAFTKGAPNKDIVKDLSARQFMNTWDVAVFRGGPKGLLHRTPDSAMNGLSILMRLDYASFWDNILKHQQGGISLKAARV